jgi:hypothetical protein
MTASTLLLGHVVDRANGEYQAVSIVTFFLVIVPECGIDLHE